MMERLQKAGRALDWLWLLAWGVASSAWCLGAAGQIGPTFDEPVYLSRGVEGWRTGSHRGLLRLGTMPLPIDVQTLPLYLYERWSGVPLDPGTACGPLLPAARAGTLVFWWLLLVYGRLAGRHIAGPWGGRAAVAVLACEPSLLAHAALATTDVAVSAALLALVYHFRTSRTAGWGWRVGVPGVWFGAAVLTKASGLVFGPLVLLAAEAERVLSEKRARGEGLRPLWPAIQAFRRDAVQIGLVGLALTFAYCGSDWDPHPSFVKWAHGLPGGPARSALVPVAENLRVFSNAGEGLVRQVKHNVKGHGVYLLGRTHPRALWYYFPVTLAIKLPLPLLLLPLALALLRPAALRNWAVLAAGGLLLFSVTCRVQIGIRLVLPLVALAAVGLAAAAVNACRRDSDGGLLGRVTRLRWLPGAALAGGVLWAGAGAVSVWPHGLCYANELWGGPEHAYLRVSDSNYDWGQGLKELARWQAERGVALDVWYFGSDPAYQALPMRDVPLHVLPLGRPEDVVPLVQGRHLAVSTTLLYGVPVNTESHRRAVAYLLARRPVARTTTFLIYDFTAEASDP